MKIEKKLIKELVDYLDEFNLSEIEYGNSDVKIKVSKKVNSTIASTEIKDIKTSENQDKEIEKGTKVTSPIIGTAYMAAEPGGKKFIEVGKKIKKGNTIMIVEAMKTMNHVPSPKDGTVAKIFIEDGQPVEFGQLLILID
jgi:acetyl-CoA carboxylase biotin carboxyl carrier protein|tara:strand:+ start:433 stop:852 length:420 start_codon:yes stop_codon:yes gene_type:complete